MHKWDGLSPTKHIDAATNPLWEGAAAVMVLYPVAVDSSKMKMCTVCMAYNAFGVLFDNSSNDKICFNPLKEGIICIHTLYTVDTKEFLLTVLSIIRQ